MIKIAVPDNKIYFEILARIDLPEIKENVEIIRTDENKCSSMLQSGKVDVALLTPIGYAGGLPDCDYRIIPGPSLLLEGFTKTGTIIFGKDMKSSKYFATDFPDDFITIIGKLLLGERYNMFPEIEKKFRTIDEMIDGCDIVITRDGEKEGRITLDISDEWFDLHENPLPLAFWVCKAGDTPNNILQIVTAFSSDKLEIKIVEELPKGKDFEPREGKLFYRWSEEFERALEYTLHFLYYHQLLSDIPAVKILGRD